MSFIFLLFIGIDAGAQERRPLAPHAPGKVNLEMDAGPVPASQMLNVTVRLSPDAERRAALDRLISDQQTAGSSAYRRWVTPTDYAEKFGATDEEIASVTAWLELQGLTVLGVSAGKTRIAASGPSAGMAAAFGVQLRQYRGIADDGTAVSSFATVGSPSVPESLGALVAGISGLDTNAADDDVRVTALDADGAALAAGASLGVLEAMVDANAASSLIVNTQSCSDFGAGDVANYEAALRQAEAQGITVLVTSACGAGSFPAGLAEVTAVAAPQETAPETAKGEGAFSMVARPAWQSADGLPEDSLRVTPDVTADVSALAGTLAGISRRAGTRLGNVAPVLYELAKMPGLYSQADGALPGTWELRAGLGVVDLKELAKDFPQGSIGTSSLFVPSSFAPAHGTMVTFTTTVTSTGGSGVPTGTVTFTSTQKGTLGTAVLNSAGVATFTTNSLAGGTYTLTSVYGGDATYTGSTSGVATVTVVGELSVMTAKVAAGAAVGGSTSIAVSVTAASGVGTPSGTVTAAPQGTKNVATATGMLTGSNGAAAGTILLPVYEAGSFTLLVSCTDPDPSFTCNSPISVQMTVGKGSTTTVLTDPASNPAVGATFTLSAAVSGAVTTAAIIPAKGAAFKRANSPAVPASQSKPQDATTSGPTGNVQFMDGTTYLGTGAIASGVANYSGTATTAKHSFNATYSGDANYTTSSSTSTPAASGLLVTSTSLTASTYAISSGQTISFYSTVYSLGVPSTMTGTVTFSAAAQGTLGTGTLSGGLATLTLNSLSPGTYVMTATYSGDTTFAASSSVSSVIVTVSGGVATLAGSFTPANVPYGSDAVLTATASFPAGSVGGPNGTLVATIAGVTGAIYTQTLLASATSPASTALFTFPAPPPGIYTVTISCPAADTFTCTAPVKVPLTVVRGGTATAVTLTPPGPLAGQPVTMTATISNIGNDPRAYTFTGTVQFFANNQLLGTAVVNGVTASIIAALPAGAEESITAVYSGDVDWATSISTPIVLTVAALPTTIVVTSNVTTAIAGVNLQLTATVTNIAGGPLATTAPTGSVSFYDTYNSVVSKLGTALLVSQGANTSIATFNATGLATGSHNVYAVYLGDTIYLGSTSPAITIGSTNFAVTFVPATMAVAQGKAGAATLVVNFQGGFGGTVSFGCTPPPNVEMTCSFSPAVLTASGTTTLNVGTVVARAVHGSAQTSDATPRSGSGGRAAGGALLTMLFFCFRSKRRLSMVLATFFATISLGFIGCTGTNGASSNPVASPPITTPTVPGTSLGTQVLTITTAGSDGTNTVRHDFQYQVTVQ